MILLRKVSFYLGLLGIAGIVLFTLQMAATEPVRPPPVPPPAKPYPAAIAAAGIVEACQENTLIGVPVGGLVIAVRVRVWDKVKKGDPLFELDQRELAATLLVQKAQGAVAEASCQRLRDQLRRLADSAAARVVTKDEIETRRHDVAVAEAQLGAAQAAMAQTERLMDRLIVRAPIAGTVLQVNIREGEYIAAAARPPPLVMGDIERLQVRADVDEQLAPRVRPGARAVGYRKGDAAHPLPMTFVRIEPFVIPKTSLTGAITERVDTRVLQVIYACPSPPDRPLYVGQQIDLYIEDADPGAGVGGGGGGRSPQHLAGVGR